MQYIPGWIVGMISPLLNLVGAKVPPSLKPILLLGLSCLVMAFATWWTPLTIEQFPGEMWALFCLVAGAYTLAKPVEGGVGIGAGITSVLCGAAIMLIPTMIAHAQPESVALPTGGQDASSFVGSIIGGLIARVLRRWFK